MWVGGVRCNLLHKIIQTLQVFCLDNWHSFIYLTEYVLHMRVLWANPRSGEYKFLFLLSATHDIITLNYKVAEKYILGPCP